MFKFFFKYVIIHVPYRYNYVPTTTIRTPSQGTMNCPFIMTKKTCLLAFYGDVVRCLCSLCNCVSSVWAGRGVCFYCRNSGALLDSFPFIPQSLHVPNTAHSNDRPKRYRILVDQYLGSLDIHSPAETTTPRPFLLLGFFWCGSSGVYL